MLKKKSLVLAKIESTYGIDPTPVAANDAILVTNPVAKPVGELLQRNHDRPSLSPLQHSIGMKEYEITFETELKGSGTCNAGGATDIPEIDPLLQACGLAQTLTAETTGGAGDGSIVYDPASTGHKSVALYMYEDGIIKKILGCRGSMSANLEAGKHGILNWTFRGFYATPVDGAIASGAAYDNTAPQPFLSAALTMGGYSAAVQSLAFDLANEIGKRIDANNANGIAEFLITGRDTNGSLDPEAVTLAVNDFWSHWENSTSKVLSAQLGQTAGNIVLITAPAMVYREINPGDRNSVRTYDMPFTLAQSAGDDELKLTFK